MGALGGLLASATVSAQTAGNGSVDYKGWMAPDTIKDVEGALLRASGGGSLSQDGEGSLVIKTDQANQFAFISIGPSGGFDASAGTIVEIEFALRVNRTAEKRDGAVMMQVFGYPVNGQPRRIDLIFDDDNVRFFSSMPKANDATQMRTYMLRISPDKSELFVEGQAEPVTWTRTFADNLSASLNELRIGDISSNDSIAGSSTWRKLIWQTLTPTTP